MSKYCVVFGTADVPAPTNPVRIAALAAYAASLGQTLEVTASGYYCIILGTDTVSAEDHATTMDGIVATWPGAAGQVCEDDLSDCC